MNKKQFLSHYIHNHMIGVLATISQNGTPGAAVMEFGDTKNLELIFDTLKSARKYKNLLHSPNVAFVIGWDEGTTVQYEGVATELHGKELVKYKNIMFAKSPDFQKWEKLPNITYFKIIPQWIRYSAMNKKPWEITF
jgi:general stress protein 26